MEALLEGGEGEGEVSVSRATYLRNRLTPEEAEQFATQGWLLVERALPEEQLWLLEELLHATRDAKLAEGRLPHETIVQAAFSPANRLQDHEATMNLLKAEKVFPKVVDIMGCNIKTYHAHFNFTPGREGVSEPVDYETAETFMYHQDSHRVNFEMGHNEPGGPRPRLSLKCAYYLTDCSESGSGNTWIVPGSHLLDELPSPPGGVGQPAGAIPVRAPRGSCLIFDRRLFHSATPNWAPYPRLVCFVGYSPRWMKARDAMYVEPSMERTSCPVVRQLLGQATTMAGLYGGNRFDMPLRHWLHEIGVDTGLGLNLKIADSWGTRGLGESPSGGLDGDRGHATFPRNPERIHLPLGEEVGRYTFPGLADAEKQAEQGGGGDGPQLQLEPAPGIELDPEAYIANRLTPEERQHFETEGYVIVKNALPPEHHESLLAAVGQARAESIATGQNTETEMTHAAAFSPANSLQHSPPVTKLLTNERILAKVVDLLGFNICCYHFHVNVTPPAADEASAMGAASMPTFEDISTSVKTFRFHQDSGQPTDMEVEDFSGEREPPQFSLKCGYVLTDTPEAGMANTWIIPRQHKYDHFDAPPGGIGQPDGAIPVCCPANSCFIFDRRLFHTPTPNWSPLTRQVCFVGYGFRWIQPKDGMYVEPAMEAATCPILKQMLGYTTSNAGLYQPNAADTPLRPWLHSIGIDEPLGPARKRPEFGATDGLLPLPRTVRELEAAGMFEGDTGHTTAGRTDDYYRRIDAAGSDGQSMKEKLDAEERGTLSQAKM